MTSAYEKKNCLLCGNEFTPRNGAQVYCSKTCRKLARKQRDGAKVPPYRICKHCGAKFEPTSNVQLYCCEACRIEDELERRKQMRAEARKHMAAAPKVCAVCGKEFIPKNRNQRFCSDECVKAQASHWHKAYRGKKSGEESRLTTCIICGKQFESHNGRMCCSPECADENARRHKRTYAARLYQARLAMTEHGTCPICGKEFTKKHSHDVYCSAMCALESRRRKSAKAREKRAAEPPGMKPCKRCGKLFRHGGKALQFCDDCRDIRAKEQWQAQAERLRQLMAERTPKPNRKCHDCGKPTWDYRCPECLKKWRAKNRVPENYANLSDEEDAHVWL